METNLIQKSSYKLCSSVGLTSVRSWTCEVIFLSTLLPRFRHPMGEPQMWIHGMIYNILCLLDRAMVTHFEIMDFAHQPLKYLMFTMQ